MAATTKRQRAEVLYKANQWIGGLRGYRDLLPAEYRDMFTRDLSDLSNLLGRNLAEKPESYPAEHEIA
jgi:hypothetical protein